MSTENKKRGIKRKREDVQVDLQQKIAGKLHHGLREAKHAAKKAKTFETQKLVKKLKSTKPPLDATEVAKLESQLKELKDADHDRLGAMAFFSKLKKDKVLARHSDFEAAFGAERSRATIPTTSGLSPQLESRLLSSKVLSAEIGTLISSLRTIILPPVVSTEDDTARELDEEDEEEEAVERPKKVAKQTPTISLGTSKLKSAALPTPADSDASEEEESDREVSDAESAQPIADDGWESGTVDGENEMLEGEDDDSDNESVVPRIRTAASAAVGKSEASESLFLPSLAVGFTRGDSDSDFSDTEAKVADSVRKNRRGQRARRAIWEKKYGKGAKHLNQGGNGDTPAKRDGPRQRANERPGPRQRDNTRASQPGRPSPAHAGSLPPQSDVVPRHLQSSRPHPNVPRNDGPPAPPRGLQKRAEEKPLHPSWEAKKRLKEQESAGIRPATGTRITFDD